MEIFYRTSTFSLSCINSFSTWFWKKNGFAMKMCARFFDSLDYCVQLSLKNFRLRRSNSTQKMKLSIYRTVWGGRLQPP